MRYYSPLTDIVSEIESPDSIPLDDQRSVEAPTCFTPEGFQFAIDSTSLGELKTCPRKYQYTILEGWTHKLLPPPLAFGIAFHTCTETWDKLIAHGMDKQTALLRVTRLAGLLGESLPIGDTTRSKESLVRSVVWYYDQFWDDPARTVILSNGEPAVEYSFTIPFVLIDEIQTYLCGHIDRAVIFQNEIYPTDKKTTKSQIDSRFFDKFKPDSQMQLYVLATNVLATEKTAIPSAAAGIIVDGVQLGVNFTRFQRQIIPYSPEEIEEFITDTEHWLRIAKYYAQQKYYPKNEKSCDMYGGCHFRPICRSKPAQRHLMLKSNFVQRTWDPLRSR